MDSIFEPGVNNQLLAAVNVVFVCLVLVIVAMFLLVGFNLHLLFMLLLSTGLLLSVNWYVHTFSQDGSLQYNNILITLEGK